MMNEYFLKLCEWMTSNQKYSWFYWHKDLLEHLPEKFDCIIEELENGIIRIWYPASKYIPKKVNSSIQHLKDKLKSALLRGDITKAYLLKLELSELEKKV